MDRLIATVLLLLILLLLFLRWRDHRRIRKLQNSAEDFLNHGGKMLDFALEEDDIAALQNTVLELETRVLHTKELQTEEASRTSSLTADISHQLKTPLTTLRLYAEMDAAPHMTQSLEQISRMENLIQGLLRLERLCADGYRFAFAPHSLKEIIEEQWSILSPIYPNRELAIQGDGQLRCDGKWLGEAFGNLLKNACEHTYNGGSICLRMEQTSHMLFCTIEDNGGGVQPKDLPHLFDRFYRAEHQDSRGAGLGLAIVREIIRRHHGTIIASNGAKGLRMEITLPILEETLTNS